uniref:Putative pro-pol protein n=1 Tax=Moniliophthora roreri TaxID=221103 RepID=A0A0W0G932_MONRR
MFIGYEWIKKHNPDINWTTKLEDDSDEEDDEIEPGDQILMIDIEHEIQIRARENILTGIAIEAGKKEKEKSFEDIILEHY